MAWFFTTGGFLSAVQDREDADYFVVRARDEQSLLTMVEGIELCGIAEHEDGTPWEEDLTIWAWGGTDYKWRCRVSRSTFALFISYEVLNFIDYTNFKSALTKSRGEEYHKAAMNVWVAMLPVTDGFEGQPKWESYTKWWMSEPEDDELEGIEVEEETEIGEQDERTA